MQRNISGHVITYEECNLIKNIYGILSGLGTDEFNRYIWIVYYPEDDSWEIERCMRTEDDWKAYSYNL